MKDLPFQELYEEFDDALASARREKRFTDVTALKQERSLLHYTPSSIRAPEMRLRLAKLKQELEGRYFQLVDEENDEGCVLCNEYIEKTQFLLSPEIEIASETDLETP